jgi:hypothetical protein
MFFIAIGLGSSYRSVRSSCIEVGDEDVRLGGMVRTKRIELDTLASVDVEAGRTGFFASDREYLLFRQVDGAVIRFREFNCPVSPYGGPTVVRDAAALILGRLESGPAVRPG